MLRRRAILVFLFFSLAYGLFNSFRDAVQMPDEEYVLTVTANLVSGKPLHLPPELPKYPSASQKGPDGNVYSVYQIGQSILYAPFYWTTKTIIEFFEPYDPAMYGRGDAGMQAYATWLERQTRSYLLLCPMLFAAWSCALVFLFAIRLRFSDRASLILTFFYGFGTMVWPYSRFLLTESLQNTLLLGTVYLLYIQRAEGRLTTKLMLAAGALFGFLLCIRASLVVILPILTFYWFYGNRERRLVSPVALFAVPMVFMFLPQLAYDKLRFGALLSTGYDAALFSTPLWVGLYGLLFSSGKSFFIYAPVTLLFFFGLRSFWKRARHEMILFAMILIVLPLKYAGWWIWSGDPSWGPRYLLVLTPYLMLPVAEIVESVIRDRSFVRKGWIGLVFAVSMAIQLLAISVHYLYYYNYVGQAATLVPPSRIVRSTVTPDGSLPIRDRYLMTEFVPEYSPILGQWWLAKTMISQDDEPALHAPWSGLGYSKFHEDVPLKVKWDLWVMGIFEGGFQILQIKKLLGAFALAMLLLIVGQELFRTPVLEHRD